MKDMRYRSLHHHSTYSYLDGFALPESHARRAAELQMPGLALTDHGNISGHVKLEQAAKKEGIKPIFGCELYTGGIDEETRTQKKNHLTVIAENLEGYRNLMRLVTKSFSEGFYYQPTVDGRMLNEHKDGLVVLSGCRGSLLSCTAIGGKNISEDDASFDRARDLARRYKRAIQDSFYLEVQAFPELEEICRLNVFYEELGKELGIPLVATGDVHYTKPDENEMQIILHNVRGANKLSYEDQARSWGYDVPLCPPINDNEMFKRLVGTGLSRQGAIDAILNTEQIAERCTVELPKMENIRFPIPSGYKNRQEVWEGWIKEGWAYRKIEDRPNRNAYVRRLKHELGVIESKDFVDYFLVVSDIVKFAKDNAIPVGPARGSAAASLICYLLRITEVDPIKFSNLVFERFIDVTRKELPDIDLDFDDERRHLIKEYAGRRYGSDRVGNLGTFTTYKAKNTLDDIGRVFDVPKWEIESIKGLMLDRSSGDLRYSETIEDTVLSNPDARATFEKYPDLWKSTKLEGNVRGMGMHAAGFVISNFPITEVCAVYSRTDAKGKVTEVISADKHDAKYLGALKLDLLGLRTMGMLRFALEELGMTLQDMYDLPLDDEKTIDAFRRNDVAGIFQFEGRATKSVNEEVKPDNFLEICDVNALSRPGPLHSGASVAYVDAKFGSEPDSLHEKLDDITKNTHGQIIYQEQILRIIREIGAFDWTEHEYIRKIIGQRMGKQEFSRQWEKFWAGAQKIMDESVAQKIWGHCITAGAYAFCVTGDTGIERGGTGGNRAGGTHQTPTITIEELFEAQQSKTPWGQKLRSGRTSLLGMDEDTRVRPNKLGWISKHEPVPILKITTDKGSLLRASKVHPILTEFGYEALEDLIVGQKVIIAGQKYEKKVTEPKEQKWAKTYKGKGFRSGSENIAWVDGRTNQFTKAMKVTKARANNKCEHCGKKGTGGCHDLEFAHILSLENCKGDFNKYHSEANTLLLCNSCHKKFDYGKGERKKRWSKGRATHWETIVNIEPDGVAPVFDVHMLDGNHNYVSNGFISHNNLAHCVSYSMIAYWQMWLKVYHPLVFYTAQLHKQDDEKRLPLLQDAIRHGIAIEAPDLNKSLESWNYDIEGNRIMAGFLQIPTIGPAKAKAIVDTRSDMGGFDSWADLLKVKGIGEKTIVTIRDFVESADPFRIYWMQKQIEVIRQELKKKKHGFFLPIPTYQADAVPHTKGADREVIWLGMIKHVNLRELFEINNKRGTPLDPTEVKNPELNEWVIMTGIDETEMLSITVDRWKYPRFKKAIWGINLGEDVVLIKGTKKGWMSWRAIYAEEMWVFDTTPDTDDMEDILL